MNVSQKISQKSNQQPCPTFRPHLNNQVALLDFEKEVEHLTFNVKFRADITLE